MWIGWITFPGIILYDPMTIIRAKCLNWESRVRCEHLASISILKMEQIVHVPSWGKFIDRTYLWGNLKFYEVVYETTKMTTSYHNNLKIASGKYWIARNIRRWLMFAWPSNCSAVMDSLQNCFRAYTPATQIYMLCVDELWAKKYFLGIPPDQNVAFESRQPQSVLHNYLRLRLFVDSLSYAVSRIRRPMCIRIIAISIRFTNRVFSFIFVRNRHSILILM